MRRSAATSVIWLIALLSWLSSEAPSLAQTTTTIPCSPADGHPISSWTIQCGQAIPPQPAQPNIILLQSDDWGWPYYGFMQRYLRAKIANGDLVADDGKTLDGFEYADPNIVLPDDKSQTTAPVDQLLTPALDYLASQGSFFPIAHTSGSVCKPTLVSIMTGLHIGDAAMFNQNNQQSTSPVIPEFLPANYLSMIAGKWEYNDNGVANVNADQTPKLPFDRDMPQRSPTGVAARVALLVTASNGDLPGQPAERAKEFIDCAIGADEDACRWADSSVHEACDKVFGKRVAGTAQPFFLMFNPSIPHDTIVPDNYCTSAYFTRDQTQCGAEPYVGRSEYCKAPAPLVDKLSCAGPYKNEWAAITANIPAGHDHDVLNDKLAYLRWANVFDRGVDELLVHLRCRGILNNTVILYTTDNGNGLPGSKGVFSEHGYRTAMVVFDGRRQATQPPAPPPPLPPLPGPDSTLQSCAGIPGCRNQFAQGIDILATIRELSGAGTTCDAQHPCPQPYPPNGLDRYQGMSLEGSLSRPCTGIGNQCMVGRLAARQTVDADWGWYVLADVTDGTSKHLCKLYVSASGNNCWAHSRRLYDLTQDPNEDNNLYGDASTCGRLTASLRTYLEHRAIVDEKWTDQGMCCILDTGMRCGYAPTCNCS